jgi:hypothetical protein
MEFLKKLEYVLELSSYVAIFIIGIKLAIIGFEMENKKAKNKKK